MDKLQCREMILKMILVIIVMLSLFWYILVRKEMQIITFDTDNRTVISDNSEISYNIDLVSYNEEKSNLKESRLCISGWIAKPGEDISDVIIRIALKENNTGRTYLVPTTVVARKDVTEHFSDGKDYDASGFIVKIPLNRIPDFDDHDYEIYALYTLKGSQTLVSMGTTIKTWRKNT